MPSGIYIRKINPITDRFWKKVTKTDTCWLWTGSIGNTGYGQLRVNRKTVRAHRVSWELHNSKILSGMCVLHKCDNPPCVNPDHLFLGTHKDNASDREYKERGNHARGSAVGISKLQDWHVVIIRKMLASDLWTGKSISELFAVNNRSISNIKNNRTWKHI